jgi:hypothetical protein
MNFTEETLATVNTLIKDALLYTQRAGKGWRPAWRGETADRARALYARMAAERHAAAQELLALIAAHQAEPDPREPRA